MYNTVEKKALEILKSAYGEEAEFREGQLEAIVSVVENRKTLVVQKTGWGKSIVYFIATKILRERSAGPTIIISPLLALMTNQVEAAEKLGLNAVTINSSNREEWDNIFDHFNEFDAIIISPERLSNEIFQDYLSDLTNVKLFVVDEAHSISDWGHDFRPDYQRIVKLLLNLPDDISILGTTATANDRVIKDIKEQLGQDLDVVRGDLIRENLAIQINPSQTREERLAWLAYHLLENDKLRNQQGIIYCLTRRDCEKVANFLREQGVSAQSYHSGLGKDSEGNLIDQQRIQSFDRGDTKILVSTIKLGMGYDKKDIRFVIHYQLPQNLISYYQQIGRAGRDGKEAYAILLHGTEDEEIIDSFIKGAQSNPDLLEKILELSVNEIKLSELLLELNIRKSNLEKALKYLIVHNYIYKDKTYYRRNSQMHFDVQSERIKQEKINQVRYNELEKLKEFLISSTCQMRFVATELDAPDVKEKCDICVNCKEQPVILLDVNKVQIEEANAFLRNRHGRILPRKQTGLGGKLSEELRMKEGWVLSDDYYSQTGQKVKEGKYTDNHFSDELVQLSRDYLETKIADNQIDLIIPVSSLRRKNLVPNFSNRLAEALDLECVNAVIKTTEAQEQKTLLNSAMQEENIRNSVTINRDCIQNKRILLVDDMVDSRWSFTVIAAKLLAEGAKEVYPYALVNTGNGD